MNEKNWKMTYYTLKKTFGLLLTCLFLGAVFFFLSFTDKEVSPGFASDPGLYVHAVSDYGDTQAWQEWQSVHDKDMEAEKPGEKWFFLPSSAGTSQVDIYNGFEREVVLNGVKIAPFTTETVPYETGVSYSVAVGEEQYTLTLMKSNAEAAIYINNADVDGSGLDLMTYLNEDKSRCAVATGAIVTPNGRIDSTDIKRMKGRGNTSWKKSKKGYNITYEHKVSIAGMHLNKKYSLVPNYQDDSLSRNRILYDLADAVDIPYAPASRYVDFYVNGYYWGSYLMCEKIDSGSLFPEVDEREYRSGNGRLKKNFSFVAEVNPSAGDDDCWVSVGELKITIKSPQIDAGQPCYDEVKAFVKEKFSHFYEELATSDTISGIADVESLAKLYLINELGKNWDSGSASTFFVYKEDENGLYKFYGSPVWDYDNSLGNAAGIEKYLISIGVKDYEKYTGWWCRCKGRFNPSTRLSDNIMARISLHPEIQDAIPGIWFEDFIPALEHFSSDQDAGETDAELKTRDEYLSLIRDSALMNYRSGWQLKSGSWIADHSALNKAFYDPSTQKMTVETNPTSYEQSFEDMYNYAADWMLSRAAWLSEQFQPAYTALHKKD